MFWSEELKLYAVAGSVNRRPLMDLKIKQATMDLKSRQQN